MATESDPTPHPHPAPHLTGRARAGLVVLLAVLSAATWFGWFSWDTTYQTDADGNQSGPYETWQGIGAALTILGLTVVGAVRLGTWPTALGSTVGFTAGFVVTSAPQDDSGLWLVGALFMAVGVFTGTAVVAALVVRWRRRHS